MVHTLIFDENKSDANLGNQQLNIEKRCPQSTGNCRNQDDNNARDRIIVAIGIGRLRVAINFIPPFFRKELQCPRIDD
jgi:hypothetical protein